MSYLNYTAELFGLKGFNVEKIEETKEYFIVDITKEKMNHTCPSCRNITNKVHDYRNQKIRHTVLSGKMVILNYRKRRYICPSCNKRFYENASFIAKGYQISKQLISLILRKFNQITTYTDVAREYHLSPTSVIRYYDNLSFSKSTLPQVIGLDEFKGNLGGEKFQTIITNPKKHNIIGFVKSRKRDDLDEAMLRYKNRSNVKLVVMDMSTIYKGLAHRMFPNAEIVADKYHVIRLSSFALENVRKKEQNRFSKEHRKRIKTQKRLLKRSKENLHEEEMCRLANLFEQMPRLGKSYYLHEKFRKIFKAKDLKEAEKLISNWELEASVSKIDEFKDCIKALENWRHEIMNIFRYEITNGYTEGCNNKSKVLKRVSYGLMNYERFVKRRMQLWQNI
ncbi:MAG: ISL3 family transposase [Peptostreptococcaceae bacterium]|nr:ISL3 family transposase [Peptostreptococcaceae bacterium]